MTAPRPRLTVLVPTIGRMAFLPAAEQAIAAQTFRDFEVIVLDNESGPEAQEFFAGWAARDGRVRVSRTDPRVPMFDNFDRGIREAQTEYVVFFHDDDVYYPELLERAVRALDAHPGAGFWGSNYDFVDEDGRMTEKRRWVPRTGAVRGDRYLEMLLTRGRNPIPMPGIVYRRSIFGDRGFDRDVPIHFGDFVILMRMAERADVCLDARSCMAVRRHEGQASVALPWSKVAQIRSDVLHKYLDELLARSPEKGPFVRGMRERVETTRRLALLWGAAQTRDGKEAALCVEGLAAMPLWHAFGKGVQHAGFLRDVVPVMTKSAKRLGERLGF